MDKAKATFFVLSLFLCLLLITPQTAKALDYDSEDTSSNGIEITKENFSELYETAIEYDTDKDGWFSEQELSYIETLCISDEIKSLEGIQHFTSLTTLYLASFQGKTLTIPEACKNIKTLYVEPSLSSVKINAPYVSQLIICPVETKRSEQGFKTITSYLIGPSKGTVKKVDLSNCKSAFYIAVSIENISNVVLPAKGNNLKILDLYYLNLKTINLSNANKVQCLYLIGCEKLSKLDTSGMSNLHTAYIHFSPKLTSFDFSTNKKLEAVSTDDNTTVRLPKGKKTTWYHGQTASMVYDISENLRTQYQCCYISTSRTLYQYAVYNEDTQTETRIKISKQNFPSFYKVLKDAIYDYNQDGWLSDLELQNIKTLIIQDATSDLTGIEKLTSLKKLIIVKFTGNTLTVHHPTLEYIMVEPYAKKLIVNAPDIKQLYIGLISIYENGSMSNWHSGTTVTTNVDVSRCKAAHSISIGIETVSSLKLPAYKENLAILDLVRLQIKNLNLSSYTNLQYLRSYYCEQLTKLDVSKNTKLVGLWFSQSKNTKIRKLNLSNNKVLEELDTYGDSTLKVTLPKGGNVTWSKSYNTGVYKIENRVKASYSLKDY